MPDNTNLRSGCAGRANRSHVTQDVVVSTAVAEVSLTADVESRVRCSRALLTTTGDFC
jgi:hypothetical protein